MTRKLVDPVTYGMFRRQVAPYGWTPKTLCDQNWNLDRPQAYFNAVWDQKLADVVISSKSVLTFYFGQKKRRQHKGFFGGPGAS